MNPNRLRWLAFVSLNLCAWGMLGFLGTSRAAPPQGGRPPFDNAVEQRNEMIRELKEIKALLKEQVALLRAANEKQDAKR